MGLITIVTLLITPLISTHEPPSIKRLLQEGIYDEGSIQIQPF